MRVSVDTNILVRAAVRDDPKQARLADRVLQEASILAVSTSAVCEFVWVVQGTYGFSREETETAITALLAIDTVITNRPAIEAGIRLMHEGGDFSDAVIAHDGRRLGGEVFMSFDKKAVRLLSKFGHDARTPDKG